jgi:SlyX protein
MLQNTEDRFMHIESKLAFLESTISQLEKVCAEQGVYIDRLTSENRLLRDKYRELQDSLEDVPNARPPHY